MSRRTRRRRGRIVALVTAVGASLGLAIGVALAFNPTLSNFEIDGDLFSGVDQGEGGGPTGVGVDWAEGDDGVGALLDDGTDNPDEPGSASLITDPVSGNNDTSTFSASKENDNSTITDGLPPAGGKLKSQTPWKIVTGQSQPKDDLTNSYFYALINDAGTQADVVVGAERTSVTGESHLDFEFNQLDWVTCPTDADSKCPQRMEGDVLVAANIDSDGVTTFYNVYVWDLPGGIDAGAGLRGSVTPASTTGCDGYAINGTAPAKFKSCPWEEVVFQANEIVGVLNQEPIDAGPWGSKDSANADRDTIPTAGFFEAFLDFDELGFPPSCPGFANASVKTRASGEGITSSMSDLSGPVPIDLNTCGKITIIKNTDPNALQDFDYATAVTTPGAALSPATFKLDDDSGVTGADNTLATTRVYSQVTPGAYSVTETAVAGYNLTSLTCTATGTGSSGAQDGTNAYKANITVGNLGEVTCTYVNTLQQGAIKITKTNGKGGALANATFSIKRGGNHINGSPFTTNSSGVICVDSLSFGSYDVKEETAPPGYIIDDPSTKTVVVDNNATCADPTYVGEARSFTNTPLSKFEVIFTSLAGAGVTRANISCSVPAVTENGAPDSLTISGNTAANPTVVTTTTAHGLTSGAKVRIAGSTSTPSLNGLHTVTVLSATTFSVPVAVTIAGNAGTVTPYDDTSETFGGTSTSLVPGVYTCTIDIDP